MESGSRTTGQGVQRINPWMQFHGLFLPRWLLLRPEITIQAKVLYAQLATLAGRRGVCWPSQHWLGKQMGVKERQLRNYLAELTDTGLVEVHQRGRREGGLGQTAYYRFLNHRWITGSLRYGRQTIAGHNPLPGNTSAGHKSPPSKDTRARGLGGSLKTRRFTAETPAANTHVKGRSHGDLENPTPKPGGRASVQQLATGLADKMKMPAMKGLPNGRR